MQALEDVSQRGWGLASGYVEDAELQKLRRATQSLFEQPGALPDSQYFFDRQGNDVPRLARVERVAEAVLPEGLRARLQGHADQCLGAPTRLFKDKLNIRYPRSKGYAPHQDAARWDAFGERFLSVGIFLSDSSPENGGFEFASLPSEANGLKTQGDDLNVADYHALPRVPLRARAGDVLLIDGMAPHRTTDNLGDDMVLHLLITFGTGGAPDARDRYYAHQREMFDSVRTGNIFVFEPRT